MGHPKGRYRAFFQEKNSPWVREGRDFAGQQILYQQTVGETASHSKGRIIESLFREAEIQRLPCPFPICQLSPNSALKSTWKFPILQIFQKKKERDYTNFPTPTPISSKEEFLKIKLLFHFFKCSLWKTSYNIFMEKN